MKGLPFVLLFTAMTFMAWGAYGPILHHGTAELSDSMRAFVGVGVAYFLIAVLFPFLALRRGKEPGQWTLTGIVYSLIAGSVGAVGALGVILALAYGGRPVYVMPLVFGFAPVVNTLVTAYLSQSFSQVRPLFLVGILAAALGAGGVLFFKPAPASAAHHPPESSTAAASENDPAAEEAKSDVAPATAGGSSTMGIVISIVIAAFCWGSYGPMLHIGQAKMSGSRLRPFACVGMAYFFIAVAAPLMIIYSRSTPFGSWTTMGMTFSFLAGVAGAIGALGVILAFNAGGKPYYVMPLIFGFAPVINTFISLTEAGTWSRVELRFWISLAVVIAGAVTVLINAPKPNPAKGAHTSPTDKKPQLETQPSA
ncbi:MAG: hypothetical protein KDB22_26920 [Planctomycetales bacterium]|nr:hypothetical protein [Planctomycetales bacterium]